MQSLYTHTHTLWNRSVTSIASISYTGINKSLVLSYTLILQLLSGLFGMIFKRTVHSIKFTSVIADMILLEVRNLVCNLFYDLRPLMLNLKGMFQFISTL